PTEPPTIEQGNHPRTLYIRLGPDGAFKAGTCSHCVIWENGRPARAWSPEGDRELDFARDQLLAELAELGVQVTERHAYVCP
ncbi:MAG TPA: hypothetical protein VF458_11600, partial [Ktedonobacteraceae bacterium]